MANNGGVDDTCDGTRGGGAFVERLGVFFLFDKAGKALEEFADSDGGAVEMEEAFEENADGEKAAPEEEVNERPPFIDEMDHGWLDGRRYRSFGRRQ